MGTASSSTTVRGASAKDSRCTEGQSPGPRRERDPERDPERERDPKRERDQERERKRASRRGRLGGGLLLCEAVESGDLRQVEVLLQAGEDPDKTDAFGITALQVAAWKNRCGMVRRLSRCSLKVDGPDTLGQTALVKAVQARCGRCVRVLLEAGAHPDSRDRAGATPLMAAVERDATHCVTLLLAQGADPAARNHWEETALHVAVMLRHEQCVGELLRAGARADLRNKDGNTAVFLAASHKPNHTTFAILKLLIQANCDLDLAGHVTEESGGAALSPFELALRLGFVCVAAFLYLAGSDVQCVHSWKHQEEEPEVFWDNGKLRHMVRAWGSEPRSLAALTRLALRKELRQYRTSHKQLALPKLLKNYVGFDDLALLEAQALDMTT